MLSDTLKGMAANYLGEDDDGADEEKIEAACADFESHHPSGDIFFPIWFICGKMSEIKIV